MFKSEVIIVTGEKDKAIANRFERLEVIYPKTHDQVLDSYFLSNNVNVSNVKGTFSLIRYTLLGNLIFENSSNCMLIGIPLQLTEMQSSYLDKIRPYIEENIDNVCLIKVANVNGEEFVYYKDSVSVNEIYSSKVNQRKLDI